VIEKIRGEHAAAAAQLPASVLSAAQRLAALEALADTGLPTARDENWRYANLRAIDRTAFAPIAARECDSALLPPPLPGFARFTLVDGILAPNASSALGDAAGLQVSRAASPARLRDSGDERFAWLNDVFALDALRVEALGGGPHQVEVVYVTTASATRSTVYPRLAIHAGPGTQLTVVERHVGANNTSTLTNAAVSVVVDAAATLHHVRWQAMGTGCTWIDTLAARVDRDALYRLRCLATGASAARSTLRVALAGRAAQCDFVAAAIGDGTQVLDTFAEVDHAAPGAATRQLYRGIAGGRSQVAFNGKMIVRQDARGARSDQSLKSLLAGPEAQIAARPQLEIYTDDVSASHGATAGKLDDMMLFYLLSRGLEREVAQRLLKWAFLEDAISQVEPAPLRREMEGQLAGRFADIAALDGLLGLHT
jgi:Fe-S cluster assembly protein SufD